MRQLIRNITLCVGVLLLSIWAVYPPEKELRLGRDLGGGTSLIYTVQVGADDKDVIPNMIKVLKDRIDPKGLSEIQFLQRGRDRIEITMPAPSEAVQKFRKKLDDEIAKLSTTDIDTAQVNRMMGLEGAARDAEIDRVAGADAAKKTQLKELARLFDAAKAAREPVDAASAELKGAKAANADKAVLDQLQVKVDALAETAALAAVAYESAAKSMRGSELTPLEMRRILSLSSASRSLRDEVTGQVERLPSPRETTLKKVREQHPEAAGQIEAIVKAYDEYAKERRGLDDPSDLKRLVANAGVLSLRITVKPGEHGDENRLRQELREHGPKGVRSSDARWYKVNRIENWYESAQQLATLNQSPALFFSQRGYVAEGYGGEYFMLAWDIPGSRLTRADGDWGVSSAYIGPDDRGLTAIKFNMNAQGSRKLGDLTGPNVGKQMAVLLDDEVYTAPTLQSKISASAQITGGAGGFSQQEADYIARVLSAGSLQAKLSPEPISQSTLGPELGKDNLNRGLYAGGIAFALVAAFMVVYYFQSGLIACVALGFNFVLLLAVMAVNKAAFTMPGIAGVVLTFGQAIDSNVLIYERMREEFYRGADMRTAVRLGFSRALSPIVDGNISNLIICVVLGAVGTQEIKGFAITLGIGVVTTLFSSLFVSHVIFSLFVDHLRWRKTSQLPMVWPGLQRFLTPHIDWMKHRWGLLGTLTIFLVAMGILAFSRGDKLLSTEFRGGTEIELTFKNGPDGKPMTMTRADVEAKVRAINAGQPSAELFREAEVLPVNPKEDGITSDHFKISMFNPAEFKIDEQTVVSTIVTTFADAIESRPALSFIDRDQSDWKKAAVYKIFANTLKDNIDLRAPGANKAGLTEDVSKYIGGLAVVLEDIQPQVSKESILQRLEQIRQQTDYSDTLGRIREIKVLEGNDAAAKTAVVLVRDESLNSYDNETKWGEDVAAREWRMVTQALSQPSKLARADSFSAAIAATFAAQAIVASVLSLMLLTIYVWVRFGTGRWALAATVPLFADVIGIVGLIALAQVLYENPSTNAVARSLGLLPFKMDLAQVAAILTIVGYSLNDKIIILDRIRENKGKLPYASYHVINDSINQTLSRTVITAGAHLISTVILYLFGGEGVRGFAYTFNLGVILGTYTSIVSSPLVWSRKADKAERDRDLAKAAKPVIAGNGSPAAGTSSPPSTPPGRVADRQEGARPS